MPSRPASLALRFSHECLDYSLDAIFVAGPSASPSSSSGQPGGGCPAVAPSCLDALIVYHEDDAPMLIGNGGLEAAMQHLVGVRRFFILSASSKTFRWAVEGGAVSSCWPC